MSVLEKCKNVAKKRSLQLIQIRERKHFLLGNHSQTGRHEIDMQEISVNLGHNLTEMAKQEQV
jgi:hypothetical protein